MRVIPQSAQNKPMPEQTLPVLYWSETTAGWWPSLGRACPTCRGYLTPEPPDTSAHGPGRVVCMICSRDVAEIQDRRRAALTPEQWAALPNEHGKRRSKVAE